MADLKGIFALFTVCLLLGLMVNLSIFYKKKKVIPDILILSALLLVNQLIEFITSFSGINLIFINFLYIQSFNFTVSLSGYYLLKQIQPESNQNWKAFLLTMMLFLYGIFQMSSFNLIAPGFFFTSYRYFASYFASQAVLIINILYPLFFLIKYLYVNKEIRSRAHYKVLFAGYIIPVIVFTIVSLASIDAILFFESLYAKLMVLNILGFSFFIMTKNK